MRVDNYSKIGRLKSHRVPPLQWFEEGETRFFCVQGNVAKRITTVLTTLLLFACQAKDDSPLDPFHLPPFVSSFSVSPTSFNTDTINVGLQRVPTDQITLGIMATAQVSDPEGLSDLSEVSVRVFKPDSQIALRSVQIFDDGKPPDAAAGDGVYSGLVSFVISRSDIGDFSVEVAAHDKANLVSNSLIRSVTILRLNRPPVLSELSAPDSLIVGASAVTFKLTVRATDPDGQGDIAKVFFNSFRPEGTPSSGNPFQMYDDGDVNGLSGDITRGDGVYSLTVQLPPNTTKGNYRFEFQAADRSGASSNLIIHTITVR